MLSGYRIMWMLVMFDLPVVRPQDRRAAARFRLDLLDLGFEMAQYSVYLRFCASGHQFDSLAAKVAAILPEAGRVSIITVTDKQFERTLNYVGGLPAGGKAAPEQFTLF